MADPAPARTVKREHPGAAAELGWLEKEWSLLVQAATALLASIGAAVLPPPGDLSAAGGVAPQGFAAFLVAVLAGFLLILTRLWKRRKDLVRWVLVGLTALLLTVVTAFLYFADLRVRTVEYAGERVVIGSTLTPLAEHVRREQPHLTNQQLLLDAAGDVQLVWTADSVESNALRIFALYLLSVVSAAACIIALVQALKCRKP